MMTPEQWQRVQEILDAALDHPAAERQAFLGAACATEPGLRRTVESLLALDLEDDFLERPPYELPAGSAPGTDGPHSAPEDRERGDASLVGRQIGPYRILREIGQGGMGVVYEAEQHRPVSRRVALKVVKRGMDTDRILARFASERQALAMMSHPHIAAVFEAGATEDGRPYFAMEYVEGLPVTEHCDARRLEVADRLRLFIHVCRAIQHAHQKGVIHRDIKPSNVLVTTIDGAAVPKVIDFGVAKATGRSLTERSLVTGAWEVIGTPAYMSPEQTAFGRVGVDTRSDVYSLGVLLYELLTGVLPLDPQRCREADPSAVGRMIREEEPPSPAARIHSLGAAAVEAAGRRRTEPRALVRYLGGDLEWIVEKALAKDPERRYAGAAELAEDVARHLAREPVLAGPPSTTYRLGRFLRRHRLAVAAGALLAAALTAATVVSTAGLVRARQAEEAAQREAQKAAAIAGFLEEMLNAGNPEVGEGREATIVDALEWGLGRLSRHFAGRPEVEAEVRQTIANTFRALGRLPEAEEQLRAALALVERRAEDEGSADRPELRSALNYLGLVRLERGDDREAESLFRRTLTLLRGAPETGPDEIPTALGNLAVSLIGQGRLAEAEPLLLEVLARRRAALGDDHELVAMTRHNLAGLYERQGRIEEAEALERAALAAARQRFPEGHPGVAFALASLAELLDRKGDHAAAWPHYLEAIEMATRTLGPDHWRTGRVRLRFGRSLLEAGRPAEARTQIEAALAALGAGLGAEDPRTLEAGRLLASLTGQGDPPRPHRPAAGSSGG